MPVKKRVLIVDDHPLFRDGLKSLIERSAGYETIGEAGSGEEAIRLARELNPELITMDVSLPDMTGIEATRQIFAQMPDAKILMLSMHPRFEYVAEAFRAGAKGYVVKEATSSKLILAMDAIFRGEYYLDGNVSQEVISKLVSNREGESSIHDDRYGQLSPREQQVMRLIAEGVPTKNIATRLELSTKTVENHRGNLMKKLDVHTRMELVRYAARLGIIDVEGWKET